MSTNGSPKTSHKPILEEVGKVGLVLSFIGSEVTLSGLTVVLAKLFGLPGGEEIYPILDVLLTSFPLTVAAAIIFVRYKQSKLPEDGQWTFPRGDYFVKHSEKLKLSDTISILAFAVAASFILNLLFDFGIKQVPFRLHHPFIIAASYLYNYFTMYGPFPLIKSCVLGYFFGKWYLQLASTASNLWTKQITFASYSPPIDICDLQDEKVERIVFTGKPIVCHVGSSEITVEFKVKDDRLAVELAKFDADSEAVLPALALISIRCARMKNKTKVEWIIHPLNGAESSFQLQRVMKRRGLVIKDVEGIGKTYHLLHEFE